MKRFPVIFFVFGAFLFFQFQLFYSDIKIFEVNGQRVKVTHNVDPEFYGIYSGTKEGYLRLNADGSGEYVYDDYSIFPDDCKKKVITIDWGFFVDEDNEIVRFERDYGYSYPVLYLCREQACFQGCAREYLVDYILDKGNGKLIVSSSDDWERAVN